MVDVESVDPSVHYLRVQHLQDPEVSPWVHGSQAWVVVQVLDVAEIDVKAAEGQD